MFGRDGALLTDNGINMGGEFFLALNSCAAADINRSSLLLAHPGHSFTVPDPSSATYAEQQGDGWRFITVTGTEHDDFSDVTLWKQPMMDDSITENISGTRMFEISNALIGGCFNWTLLGQDEPDLFNHPAAVFP